VENERIGRLAKIVTCTECSRINDWHFTATNKIVRAGNIVRRVIKWRKAHGPCAKWTRMLVRVPLWPIHLVCFEMTLLLPAMFKWKNATKWRGDVKATLISSHKVVDSDMDAPTHARTRTRTHQQICRISLRRPQFGSRKFYIRFVKDKVASGWVLLQVRRFFSCQFIPLICQFTVVYH